MSANGVLLLIFAIYMIAFGFVGLKTGNKKVKDRKSFLVEIICQYKR